MLRSAGGGTTAGAVTTAGTLTAGQVAYGSGAQTVTSDANFTYNSGTNVLTATGYNINGKTAGIGIASALTALVDSGTGLLFWDNSNGLRANANLKSLGDGSFDLGGSANHWKRLYIDYTITAPASTGNKTINKAGGSIRIAAAGTSVTLTNSLVTANSLVFAQLSTVDTTAKSVVTAVTSTQVVFTLNAAATAEVEIRWFVVSTD